MVLRLRIELAWKRFVARCQRFRRGWAYSDAWDIDWWLRETLVPMLRHVAENGKTYPMDTTPEAWRQTLLHMADLLRRSCADDILEEKYGLDEIATLSFEEMKEASEIAAKNKNEFFELFSKYFYDLWD